MDLSFGVKIDFPNRKQEYSDKNFSIQPKLEAEKFDEDGKSIEKINIPFNSFQRNFAMLLAKKLFKAPEDVTGFTPTFNPLTNTMKDTTGASHTTLTGALNCINNNESGVEDEYGLLIGTNTDGVGSTSTSSMPSQNESWILKNKIRHSATPAAGKMEYRATLLKGLDLQGLSDSGASGFVVERSFKNTSGGTISIGEIGLFGKGTVSGSTKYFCLIRDTNVLMLGNDPMNISVANGETIIFRYTIQVNPNPAGWAYHKLDNTKTFTTDFISHILSLVTNTDTYTIKGWEGDYQPGTTKDGKWALLAETNKKNYGIVLSKYQFPMNTGLYSLDNIGDSDFSWGQTDFNKFSTLAEKYSDSITNTIKTHYSFEFAFTRSFENLTTTSRYIKTIGLAAGFSNNPGTDPYAASSANTCLLMANNLVGETGTATANGVEVKAKETFVVTVFLKLRQDTANS